MVKEYRHNVKIKKMISKFWLHFPQANYIVRRQCRWFPKVKKQNISLYQF